MSHETILSLFPALATVTDIDLREKTIQAICMAMQQGGWNEATLNIAPTSLRWKGYHVPWAEHVADVVELSIAAYDILKKYYERNGIAFSRDILVCGAILHDIGKLTEYSEENGQACLSDNCKLMRHPLSGAIIAAKCGLPDQVVHLIATHSFEGDKSYHTPESVFVRTLDMFAYEASVAGKEKIM